MPNRVAFLGGFPPRLCGIATFTQDVCEAVAGARPTSDCFVCAVNDRREGYAYPPRVCFELDQENLESQVDIIPHGIPDLPFTDSSCHKARFGLSGRRVLLTFGLLGPGKGIEHAIQAMPEIVRRYPDVIYVVLGATHPNLVAREGESYRHGLERMAGQLGVREHVSFHDQFVSMDELKEFIGATDVYLTPYLNEAQITSGTLAYLFGAGKPVVSTPYWHAQELLGDGRGTLVPFRDPQAIAAGVLAYLDDPERMRATRQRAYRMGRRMIWPAVGRMYLESFQRASGARQAMAQGAIVPMRQAGIPYEWPGQSPDRIMGLDG
jgi:glycosyltransferase involved in cell wall biosynthesis